MKNLFKTFLFFVEDENRKITANEDEPYNFLLEGDNLHSLKLLEKTHKGRLSYLYRSTFIIQKIKNLFTMIV